MNNAFHHHFDPYSFYKFEIFNLSVLVFRKIFLKSNTIKPDYFTLKRRELVEKYQF